MQHDPMLPSHDTNDSSDTMLAEKRSFLSAILEWWYRLTTPSLPPGTTGHSRRERMRRARIVSIMTVIFVLFLLALLERAITDKNLMSMAILLIETGICILALSLNRRGFINLAGIVVVSLVYIEQIVTIFGAPGGLTVSGLPMLDFSILPDILALAFFSANSLFLIVCLNVALAWGLLTYGPRDTTLIQLLHVAPNQTFSSIVVLQLLIAAMLYVWGRSVEVALTRADRAEEIAVFEKYDQERKQQELEQKRQLDAGIQQILQTHIAVANGNLNARAPLQQDHVLWQVAVALNNFIARHQNLSQSEQRLRQAMRKENQRLAARFLGEKSTAKIPAIDPAQGEKATGKIPVVNPYAEEQQSEKMPRIEAPRPRSHQVEESDKSE